MKPFNIILRLGQKGLRSTISTPKPSHLVRWACITASLALTACAMPDLADNPQPPRSLLQRLSDLTGARSGSSLLGIPSTGYITLRRPTAVSTRDNDVYLIDSGLNRIFRYNRFQQTLTPFTNLSVNADMSIYAAPDRSVYIADPNRSEVLHFTSDGSPLPSLVSPGNLARPVAVSVDERSGQVLVADGLFDQFIYFSNLGMTLSVVRPQRALAIAAMATGPDGIYVADRISRQVSVLGWDGAFRYSLGANSIKVPSAIAVTRDNLVFVGDNFDQSIKVYRGQGKSGEKGLFMTKIGSAGAGPGSFNGIAGLAVDGSQLYAADSMNARIQIMLINP